MKRTTFSRAVLRYTFLFLIVLVMILMPMIVRRKVFVYSGDGVLQHVPFLRFYSDWLRDTASALLHGRPVAMYSYTMGFGSDILYALNWYGMGDPLCLLYGLLPSSQILVSYVFINILRLYLAGLAMLLLINRFGKLNRYSHYVMMGYSFSAFAFTVGLLRHPFFINPLIQMPLLIVGIDKILRRESVMPFVLSVAWVALCGYYYFYMCSIFLFIVALVLHFDIEKGHALSALPKNLGRSIGWYLVGICLAGPVFFPACLSFFLCGRSGELFSSVSAIQGWLPHIARLPSSVFSYISSGTCNPAILWLSFFMALLPSGEKRRGLRKRHVLSACALLLLLLPVTGYLMNGFSYSTSRWTFALSALIVFYGAVGFPRLTRLNGRQRLFAAVISWIFVLYFGFISVNTVFRHRAHITLKVLESAAYPAFVCGSFFVSWLAIHIVNRPKFRRKNNARSVAGRVLAAVLILNLVATGYLWEVPRIITDVYRSPARLNKIFKASPLNNALLKEDGRFIRVDSDEIALTHINDGVTSGVSSTVFYNSTLPASVCESVSEMELPVFMCNRFPGLNSRAALEAVWSVTHYVRTTRGDIRLPVPYGFKLTEAGADYELYENTLALPFGYTTDAYVPAEAFNAFSAAEKQWTLLQGAALASGDSRYRQITPDFDYTVPDYTMEFSENTEWKDGRLSVKAGGQLRLLFRGLPEAETCIELKGLDFTAFSGNKIRAVVSGSEVNYRVMFSTPEHNQQAGQSDYIIQLGYSDEARTEMTLTFKTGFEARLDDIRILCQPMAGLEKYLDTLRSEAMENVRFDVNRITGTCETSGDAILVMALPYAPGWSARVNGKPEALFASGTAFTALKLDKGMHTIELTYHTPGVCAGIIGLLAGLVLIIRHLLFAGRRRVRG